MKLIFHGVSTSLHFLVSIYFCMFDIIIWTWSTFPRYNIRFCIKIAYRTTNPTTIMLNGLSVITWYYSSDWTYIFLLLRLDISLSPRQRPRAGQCYSNYIVLLSVYTLWLYWFVQIVSKTQVCTSVLKITIIPFVLIIFLFLNFKDARLKNLTLVIRMWW